MNKQKICNTYHIALHYEVSKGSAHPLWSDGVGNSLNLIMSSIRTQEVCVPCCITSSLEQHPTPGVPYGSHPLVVLKVFEDLDFLPNEGLGRLLSPRWLFCHICCCGCSLDVSCSESWMAFKSKIKFKKKIGVTVCIMCSMCSESSFQNSSTRYTYCSIYRT